MTLKRVGRWRVGTKLMTLGALAGLSGCGGDDDPGTVVAVWSVQRVVGCEECGREVYAASGDGTVTQVADTDQVAQLSPNRRWVVVSNAGGLELVSTSGGDAYRFPGAFTPDALFSVSWSPDSTQIAYADAFKLKILSIEGKHVLTTDVLASDTIWLRDNRHVLVSSNVVVDAESGASRELPGSIGLGATSPDGSWLVSGVRARAVVSRVGTDQAWTFDQMSSDDALPEYLRWGWSADGRTLTATLDDRTDFIDLDSGQLTSRPGGWACWSPVGSTVALVRDGRIVLEDAQGRLLRDVDAGIPGWLQWSQDGSALAYWGPDHLRHVTSRQNPRGFTLPEDDYLSFGPAEWSAVVRESQYIRFRDAHLLSAVTPHQPTCYDGYQWLPNGHFLCADHGSVYALNPSDGTTSWKWRSGRPGVNLYYPGQW